MNPNFWGPQKADEPDADYAVRHAYEWAHSEYSGLDPGEAEDYISWYTAAYVVPLETFTLSSLAGTAGNNHPTAYALFAALNRDE